MTLQRDRISVWFDQKSADLLRLGYAHFGEWVDAYLPPPTRAQRHSAARLGIDLDEPDPWGEPNRWVRAYKRSCYHVQLTYGQARELNTGRPRRGRRYAAALKWQTLGQVSRPNSTVLWWYFQISLMPGGQAAQDAASRLPDDERFTADPAAWLAGR